MIVRLPIVVLCCVLAIGSASAQITGSALPGLEAFDQAMSAIMEKWNIPGASLAVAKNDRLLLMRGYGFADRDAKRPVQPSDLFRVGSISKTLTAVAILKLVEDGRLALDDKVLPILGDLAPTAKDISDRRAHGITIRQLLQHTGGFDRSKFGDPITVPRVESVAQRQGVSPVTCEALLRDAFEQDLDFTPGERFAYSNVGYCILGRVIERISGERYEDFVRNRILIPSGTEGLRLGRTLIPAPGEVTYYDFPGKAAPGFGAGIVPGPYGTLPLEMMDAFGAWIGSARDILRFFLAVDGIKAPALLKAESLREMRAPPLLAGQPSGNLPKRYYGLGIEVLNVPGGINWWHDGLQPGVMSLALRTAEGYSWVVLFNSKPVDNRAFFLDFDRALWNAKAKVTRWPEGDLFVAEK